MSLQRLIPKRLQGVLRPTKQAVLSLLFGYDYQADGLAVTGHNLEFMSAPDFKAAWDFAVHQNEPGYSNAVPDIRWRAHVACWAGTKAKNLDGDFVECGVHTGLLAHTLCHYLGFETLQKTFWLFDTFDGIPVDQLTDAEKSHGMAFNKNVYFDCYEHVKQCFAHLKNVKLIRGTVPDSFAKTDISHVAYLSLDMNNAFAEVAALEYFWDRMVPGGFIVLDDYGFLAHKTQKTAIDAFLRSKNALAVTLPTGQGIICV